MAHSYKFNTLGSEYIGTSVRRRNALTVFQEIQKRHNLPSNGEVTVTIDGGEPETYRYLFDGTPFAVNKGTKETHIYI